MTWTVRVAAVAGLAIAMLLGLLLAVSAGPAAAHDKRWCARDPLGTVHCAATKKLAYRKACARATPLHPCTMPWRHRH